MSDPSFQKRKAGIDNINHAGMLDSGGPWPIAQPDCGTLNGHVLQDKISVASREEVSDGGGGGYFDIPGINGEIETAGSDTSEDMMDEYDEEVFNKNTEQMIKDQMMASMEECFPTLEEELRAVGVDISSSMEDFGQENDSIEDESPMKPIIDSPNKPACGGNINPTFEDPDETPPKKVEAASVTEKQPINAGRARLESSDISECGESDYGTVGSTSSTASLLRKTVREHQAELLQGNPALTGRRIPRCGDITGIGNTPTTSPPPGAPNYLDPVFSAGSGQALLAKTLEQVKRSLEELSPTFVKEDARAEEKQTAHMKNTYLKNLVVLSIGFMLVYTAFFSLRNLQSSINHESGLGLIAMSCLYGTFVVGCMFASSIINNMRPKWAILAALIGHLIFTVSNFYPAYYSLIPATALLGFTMATLWTAQGTYITSIAVTYAAITAKSHDTILGLFNGFFLFLIQVAQILGNLISSTVFYLHLGTENGTSAADFRAKDLGMCGSHYCHSYKIEHASVTLQHQMVYILLSVFTVFTVVGILLLMFFLNKLDVIFHRNRCSVGGQLLAVFRLHRQSRLLLLIPCMLFLGMEEALLYGEITKSFITCPLGMHWIGYVMMCFGACNALSSFVCGTLQRCVDRTVIMAIGALINCGLLVLMYLWQPNSILIIFMLVGGWGVADGVWQTQACSLCGLLFPKHREPAFASLRMYEAIGFSVSFAYSQFICMDIKIILTGGMLGLSLVGYLTLVLVHGSRRKDNKAAYV